VEGTRILVTGFGPFEDVTENVTEAVAPALGYPFRILDVAFRAVDEFLESLDPGSFDVLLALGHDKRAEKVRIETVGRNRIGERPDVRGEVHGPGPIDPRGPNQIAASLWRAPELLQETDRWVPSTDAGGYLCGYMLYRSLQAFPDKLVGFLHLPPAVAVGVTMQVDRIKEILSLAISDSPFAQPPVGS